MDAKQLHQDDRVRVLENLFDPLSCFLCVTADSTGRIMSFQQYCDYIEKTFDGKDTPAIRTKHLSRIARGIQDETAFPVWIESYAPVKNSADPVFLEKIVFVGPEALEKLE